MGYEEEVEEKRGDEERPSDVVECPSGLCGRIRKLTLREVQRFGSAKAMRSGEAFESALKDCWVETLDVGPYGTGFSWESALLGDRFYALLALRAHTFGADFDFEVQCPSAACRKRFGWRVDLRELRTKPYPEASLEKYSAGEDFSSVVGGKEVRYRLATAQTERALRKLLDGAGTDDERLLSATAYRMVRVAGLEDTKGRPDRDAIRKWAGELPADEFFRFRDLLEDAEGGVDTELRVRCDSCEEEFRLELPFGSAALWMPRRKR